MTGVGASASGSRRYGSNLKQALTNRQVLWLHAVSVGEVNLCTQIIRALELRLPNVKFVVSTTTTTGMAELRRRLPTHISKIYYPVDRRKYVGRALAVINPVAIVLVEAEIWPNFLWRARDLKIPVFPGERAAVRPVASRLQTVWLSVPPAVRVVCRCRVPERAGRGSVARGRLPA